MECKKIKDRLITAHWDGELSPAESAEVRQHMEVCAGCREYGEAVKKTVAAPFNGFSELQPDPLVWQKIRRMIALEEDRSEGWLAKIERVLAPVLRPLPAFRVVFVAGVVLMAIVLVKWPFNRVEPVYAYVEEQMALLGELQSGNPDLFSNDGMEYELPSEEIKG